MRKHSEILDHIGVYFFLLPVMLSLENKNFLAGYGESCEGLAKWMLENEKKSSISSSCLFLVEPNFSQMVLGDSIIIKSIHIIPRTSRK